MGGKTYSINLPKDWVVKMGLEKGNQLQIQEQTDGDLLIRPPLQHQSSPERSVEIVTSRSLSRDITRSYLLGYTKIIIKSRKAVGFTRDELDEIDLARQKFPGAEIMREDKNEIVIEIIASFEKNQPYKLIHSMFNLTQSMLHRIYLQFNPEHKLEQNNIKFNEEIERIRNTDKKINRKYFLIVRQLRALTQDSILRKRTGTNNLQIMDYRLIAHLLESIGDNSVRLCDHILEFRPLLSELIEKTYNRGQNRVLDSLIATAAKIAEFHRETFNAFIKNDAKRATELVQANFGFSQELNRQIADIKADVKRSSLSIISYRYFDIYDMIIDILDLIQPEEQLSQL